MKDTPETQLWLANLDEAACWQAVAARSSAHEGQFVFGVQTTGVYCRPGCKARLPLRKNVRFFALPAAAEQAGFRPCKRCQPQKIAMRDTTVCRIQAICEYIQQHLEGDLSLEVLSVQFHWSAFHLQRTFALVMGISPRQYVEYCRLNLFKARLRAGERITDAIYSAGYGSPSRVYARSETQLGMTPTHYQQGGSTVMIRYSTTPTVMGIMLVAMTERGICALKLGSDETDLIARLHGEFPRAQIAADAAALALPIRAVLDYLAGWQPHFDLPFDLRVTAFQKRVLDALLKIPYGETRTYGEIAAMIGEPKAARAVGRACATNPVPLLIPCHRVVGSDGSLTGYAYGTERKQFLLQLEQHPQLDLVVADGEESLA